MIQKTSKDWQKIKEQSELQEQDELLEDENLADELNENQSPTMEAALDHPSYLALEEKLTAAEQKAHENWEKAMRALAELDNVRRRAEKDVSNAHLFGQEKIIKDFLPVIDSLEQALNLVDKETQASMYEGLALTLKLFLDALQKQGVSQVDPQGLPFNPQAHEAMSMQETDEAAPNTVLVVFQKGYVLHERIIRPARVIVARAKTK